MKNPHITAWVDPNGVGSFRVPLPGYDPRLEKGAYKCTECKDAHIVVPEGFYQPPFNAELFKMVRGKKVDISIGPYWSKE